ncbi:MAG: Gfo/Idh/MocA family oxidoreductase [bacterium]|nr:Gfo/Idh/MocA family oxidoreductase [bacterium]
MRALRIALLGAGSHSTQNHGPAWRDYVARHPGVVELVAVCDLDADRAQDYASRFGFAQAHTDLDALFDAELDGLVAITPMEATEQLAARILQAGVPVVIEKPPGVGVEGARRLLAVAQSTGTPHMISFNRRFAPPLQRALAWMADGNHRPRHVISRMLRHNRLEADFARDTGLHQVDVLLAVIGPPTRVIGHKELREGSRAANYTARIETARGITASVVQTPDVGVAEESLEILGDGFRVWLDFQEAAVRIVADGKCVLDWSAAAAGMELHEANGAYGETVAFVQGLQSGELTPTMTDGLVTMQAIVALQQGTTWSA